MQDPPLYNIDITGTGGEMWRFRTNLPPEDCKRIMEPFLYRPMDSVMYDTIEVALEQEYQRWIRCNKGRSEFDLRR